MKFLYSFGNFEYGIKNSFFGFVYSSKPLKAEIFPHYLEYLGRITEFEIEIIKFLNINMIVRRYY